MFVYRKLWENEEVFYIKMFVSCTHRFMGNCGRKQNYFIIMQNCFSVIL